MTSQWQDISTAPVGELVWLYEPHSERAFGGFMFAGYNGAESVWRNNLDQEVQHPTHWMPLPSPPEVSE